MEKMISFNVILLFALFSACVGNHTTQRPLRVSRKLARMNNKVNYTHVDQNRTWMKARNVYAFTAKDIKGKNIPLSNYKGKIILIVNVASHCGLSILNYRMLMDIHNKYVDRGLVILAFPCNQFLNQEPGTNKEIAEIARQRDVKFTMFSKIDVNGDKAPALWKYLRSKSKNLNIAFSFTKFLVDRKGHVVKKISPASAMTTERYLKPYFKDSKS